MNDINTANDLIYLLSCAVNQVSPDAERVHHMDLDAVYALASRHMVCSIAAFSLDAAHVSHLGFAEAKAKALRKAVLFEAERRKIFSAFEQQGIRYLPLKGAVLKDDYPAFGMREMADNDILCDPDRMDDVKAVMKSLGYRCETHPHSKDDDYFKPPSLNFEMHRRLFNKGENEIFYSYFSQIRSKLLCDDNSRCALCMSDELFYLYLLAHEYKHYTLSGTGLRSLLDIYVFLKKHGDALDRRVLSEELSALGLKDFERRNRELAFAVFSDGEINGVGDEMLSDFITSGVFGTYEQGVYQSLDRALQGDDSAQAKRKHIFNRIFLTENDLREMYPFFYRHKLLRPFLFLFRVFRGLFAHPKAVLRDLRNIRRFKHND